MAKAPVRVAVTGAAGRIGYALLFRIASGEMLGADQPVILHLLDLPTERAQLALKGVMMELEDCAFPLLMDMLSTSDPRQAFRDVDYALLVGAKPRTQGMERRDLLLENARIFVEQGRALNELAARDVHVLVVGNPANTNAMIVMNMAPDLPCQNITSMMRLDHDRAMSILAEKTGRPTDTVNRMVVWGNHSPTMYPDIRYTMVGENPATNLVDQAWYRDEFIPEVSGRGAAVIEVRGLSSAASAANAIISHMHDWVLGSNGRWVTMGVVSDGNYDIPEGLIYGAPCVCDDTQWKVVADLDIDPFSRQMMDRSLMELVAERDGVKPLLA